MREPTTTLQVAWDDDLLEIDASTLQGSWTEQQYLRLSRRTNRLIEYADGRIEVVPMSTDEHQAILQWLLRILETFMVAHGGVVRVAPLRLRLPPGRFREPDLLALREATDARRQNDFWRGADLVAEVISPDDPERDTVVKRADYAAAGIAEYWLVDPRVDEVAVLRLVDDVYAEHGRFRRGLVATSSQLPDLAIEVDALFNARG